MKASLTGAVDVNWMSSPFAFCKIERVGPPSPVRRRSGSPCPCRRRPQTARREPGGPTACCQIDSGDQRLSFARQPPVGRQDAVAPFRTNAIERLHEEFKRRQDAMPAALRRNSLHASWALLASGQITLRKVDGWPTSRSPTGRRCGAAEPAHGLLPNRTLILPPELVTYRMEMSTCHHLRTPRHDPGMQMSSALRSRRASNRCSSPSARRRSSSSAPGATGHRGATEGGIPWHHI